MLVKNPTPYGHGSTSPSKTQNAGARRQTQVFLVDDHPLVRTGISQLINKEADMHICGEAEDAPDALRGLAATRPDLVTVDISLRGYNGIELIKNIKSLYPELPILVLSMHEEGVYAQRALRAGALAYVMKQEAPDKVLLAIRRILKGDIYVSEKVGVQMLHQIVNGGVNPHGSPVDRLSDRELEVTQLIGEGRTTREIASFLNVSVKTIESHRANIKEKLSLKNGPELIKFCVQWVEHQIS
jgi:DNA-binding NarL/FixJ family response regulator